jgi:large subunit ribosomal protein L24
VLTPPQTEPARLLAQSQSKRHIKRTADNPGGIVSVESPLHYSNVSLIDPVTNAPVRVSWRYLEDGSKVRVTRGRLASGSIVPRPEVLLQRRKPLPTTAGPRDTEPAQASVVTHSRGDLPSALELHMPRRHFHSPAAAETATATGAAPSNLASPGAAAVVAAGTWGGLGARAARGWRGFAAGGFIR